MGRMASIMLQAIRALGSPKNEGLLGGSGTIMAQGPYAMVHHVGGR